MDEEGSILVSQHTILPDRLRINFSEVSGLEAIVLGCQSDANGRRDKDVGPTSEELGVQMVEVVLEPGLHDCFVRLLSQDKGILIITIPVSFVFLRVLVDCFELVSFVERLDVCRLLLSFINASFLILLG